MPDNSATLEELREFLQDCREEQRKEENPEVPVDISVIPDITAPLQTFTEYPVDCREKIQQRETEQENGTHSVSIEPEQYEDFDEAICPWCKNPLKKGSFRRILAWFICGLSPYK